MCVYGEGWGEGEKIERRRESMDTVSHNDYMKLTLPLDLAVFAFQQAIWNGKSFAFLTREEALLPV